MANMTDTSTDEPKVFARCQQEFINRHVCICSRLSIHPSLSACLCITVAVCCHSVDWLWAEMAAGASICNPSTLGKGFRIMAASFLDIMLKSHLTLLFSDAGNRISAFYLAVSFTFLAPCRKHASRRCKVYLCYLESLSSLLTSLMDAR